MFDSQGRDAVFLARCDFVTGAVKNCLLVGFLGLALLGLVLVLLFGFALCCDSLIDQAVFSFRPENGKRAYFDTIASTNAGKSCTFSLQTTYLLPPIFDPPSSTIMDATYFISWYVMVSWILRPVHVV